MNSKINNISFIKKLIHLVLPIAFQQFMLALVSASDAIMLGELSQDAMSAVSLASQITFVENLFLAAMTIGLSMFAAQYWGKQEPVMVEHIFAYVMKITAIISFLFFLSGLCVPKTLMRIFTNEQILIDYGATYLRTVSFSYFLTGVSQIYLCIIKNTGKAYGGKLCRFAVASGCISGLVILALTPLILHIVNLSTVSSEYLRIMLYICSYNLIGYAITSTTIAGIFCAGGDTKFGLRCDAVVMWCITVPLGLLSAFVLKLPVSLVFFIVNLDELLKVPAAYKHYKKYLWVKDLTAHKKDEELL